MAEVRALSLIKISTRSEARASWIADRLQDVDIDIRFTSAEDAVRGSDIVVTVTPSKSPLVRNEWIGEGTHISAMGADDKGKHELETALKATGLSHAIVRPGVLFGRGDILVNNISWVLRHMPVFGVFGDGTYKLRPMYVDDQAALMMDCADKAEDLTVDSVGPETFTYRELVETIGEIIGVRRRIMRLPPSLGYAIGRCLNPFVKDVIITREEITGLMRNLLDSQSPPTAPTKLTDWARSNPATLGRRYASEVARRVKRATAYEDL
ncbi:MAG: hypothetical protein IH786_11720 [Proteobacteria bacterium]|nr:hypothetical protein [Pseudomonadota bacterium]